jgi:hypothetical protein
MVWAIGELWVSGYGLVAGFVKFAGDCGFEL